MLLTALATLIVLILLVVVGYLNPNTGETTTLKSTPVDYSALLRDSGTKEASKLDNILFDAHQCAIENGTNDHLSSESILAVYLLGEGDEVFDAALTVAIEERNASEIARLLGVPTQADRLNDHLYG